MPKTPRVLTLYPYFSQGCWMFDDERTGLKEEAFVCGASEMITKLVEANGVKRAKKGCALSFSATDFGGQVSLKWFNNGSKNVQESDMHGNWYRGEIDGEQMECWLCPALLLYFKSAPKRLYVKIEDLPEGIKPIWKIPKNVDIGRRFVAAGK